MESPPPDTQVVYFGTGEGFSLLRAKEAALNDIAGKLGTDISSKVDSDIRQVGDQVRTRARVFITAKINKIKLIHPQVIKRAKYDGRIYVLLSVSRTAMSKDAYSRLKHLDQHLKQQWQDLSGRSSLQQLIRTQKLSSEVDRATALVFSLQALDQHFVSGPYLERYNAYSQKSRALLSSAHFQIRPIKIMKAVAQNLLRLLSRDDIRSKVMKPGRRPTSQHPLIEVKGDLRIEEAPSVKYAHLTVIFEVKDKRGNTVASRKHKATGKSLSDAASATRSAMKKLMERWKREAVLNVIGLNI